MWNEIIYATLIVLIIVTVCVWAWGMLKLHEVRQLEFKHKFIKAKLMIK